MTMTLPTAKTKPTTDLAKQSILLYGVPKLGKSSFASQFPEAMFFECEPGLNHLEVFKVPTYSWEAFLEACKLLAKGDHNFKTLVIDTVDNAFKMCSDYVCAKHGIEYEGDMGHGKGWALVKNEWHRVLTRLASLPYGLILISHAVDKTIETRTGEYTKTTRACLIGLATSCWAWSTSSFMETPSSQRCCWQSRCRSSAPNQASSNLRGRRSHWSLARDATTRLLQPSIPHSAEQLRIQPHRAQRPAKALLRLLPLRAAPQQERLLSNERLREYETTNQSVDLSSFDDEFATAEAPEYDEVPDGKYQARIESVKLESSQKGDPMIKFDLQVMSGSQAGRHIFKNSVITQASLPYVKGDLKTLALNSPSSVNYLGDSKNCSM